MTNALPVEYEDELFQTKAPELISHLYSKIKVEGQAANLDEQTVQQLASKVAMSIAHDFGGEVLYIPKGLLLPLTKRDLQIWQSFNGNNHNELARKFNVSVQWVYKIVKRVQKEEVAKRQIDLFSADNL